MPGVCWERHSKGLSTSESLIIGIPRGGVLVAAEAARRFGVQAEAVVVRKIESPRQPDSSVGVLAEGGVEIIEPDTARMLGLKEAGVRSLIEAHRGPLGRPSPAVWASHVGSCAVERSFSLTKE
jgi:putative phosphoribosyl transferase